MVELTGESDQAAIMANIADSPPNLDGSIDENSIWGQAEIWLLEAEAETGMTLEGAENLLYDEEERFGNQQNYGQAIENADIHEYVNSMVEQLTGGDSIEAMDIIKEQLGRTGTVTGTWADAYELMQKAEEMTGVSYSDAMSEKWRIEGYFNDEDICRTSKLVCDYSDYNNMLEDINSKYRNTGELQWEFQVDSDTITVELVKLEWYFTIKETKKKQGRD